MPPGAFAGPGRFTETQDGLLSGLAPRSHDYTPPATIGAVHDLTHAGRNRPWRMLTPQTETAVLPAAIVLLHGSSRDGRSTLDRFRGLPATADVVLIAPDAADPAAWSERHDGAEFMASLLQAAQAAHPFDPDRVYLFGHSAGAIHALGTAAQGTAEFAAIAAHAGRIAPDRIRRTEAGVPVRVYVGEDDHLFAVDAVRDSAQALAPAGHDTDLIAMQRHTHWFYAAGPRIAQGA